MDEASNGWKLQRIAHRSWKFDDTIYTGRGIPSATALRPLIKPRALPLGSFQRLPLEILWKVLAFLTYADIEAFRKANSSARNHVVLWPMYRTLLLNIPSLLRVLSLTNLNHSFTLSEIYSVLTDPSCYFCHRFGAYCFLPGLLRCCQYCVEYDYDLMPISRNLARREFLILDESALAALPQMKTIPGQYRTSPLGWFPAEDANPVISSRTLARRIGQARPTPEDLVVEQAVKNHQRYTAVVPLPYLEPKARSLEVGVYCRGCKWLADRHHSLIEVIGRPISSEEIGKDFSEKEFKLLKSLDVCPCVILAERLYRSEELLEHMKSCDEAQRMLRL